MLARSVCKRGLGSVRVPFGQPPHPEYWSCPSTLQRLETSVQHYRGRRGRARGGPQLPQGVANGTSDVPCQAGATTRQLVRRRVIRGRYSPSDSCWLGVLNQVWEDISTLPVEEHSQTPLILRSTTDTSYLKDRFFVLVGTHSLGVYICVYYLYIFFALLHPFCLHCWFWTLVHTPSDG